MSILNQIIETKKEEIKSITINKNRITDKKKLVSFKNALKTKQLSLIAEVKQASPSKGIIYKSFNPIALAETFESKGASAISVLTDQQYFKGSINHLINVKESVSLPILRKDFIIDPIQVIESSQIGADAILLILDIVSIDTANEILDAASQYNLDVLIELHDHKTIQKLYKINNTNIIGINNRNLNSFHTNINHAPNIINELKKDFRNTVFIAESGYNTVESLETLEKNNINGVLIGEGLNKNKDMLNWFKNEN